MASHVFRAINILPDGVLIEYVDPERDYRPNGLVNNHTIFVPRDSDYDDGIDALTDAIRDLLEDALEDLGLQDPLNIKEVLTTPGEDDDEEDEE